MSKRHRYSRKEEVFLIQKVDGCPYEELAELFNMKFNASVSSEAIRQKCYALGVKNNIDPKIRKGTLPSSTLPIGAESTDEDGNPIIKIGQPREWKKKSHIVWEKHNGAVPKNHYVIFLNQNKKDCRIGNLALVSRSTFSRLIRSDMYTEDENITRVGITMTQLQQKILEHEEKAKNLNKENDVTYLQRKIKLLSQENARLQEEINQNRFMAVCFYEWGKNHRDGLYEKEAKGEVFI